MSLLRLLLIALAGLWILAQPARAQGWQGDANAAARLISAVAATGSASRIEAGLEFRFGPGWHGYWRNPGDAGFAPTLDWTGSDNLAEAEILWPRPTRTSLLGIDSLAYDTGVILPLVLTPLEPGRPLRLRLAVDYLACADLCVPYRAELALDLPAGPAQPTLDAAAIASFLAQVPGPVAAAGLRPGPVRVGQRDGQWWLTADLAATPPLRQPDLFLHGVVGLTGGAPSLSNTPDGQRLSVKLAGVPSAGLPADTSLHLTLVDGTRAAEYSAPLETGLPAPSADWAALLTLLATAWLGGLILNIMPCVLPVLSLKILALANHVGGTRRDIRAGLAMTALGIMASFLLLALAALGLRHAGIAIGWGMQFQQPLFLVFMIGLLTLFAASLFGWLAIDLPGRLADAAAMRARHPLADALVSGLFATLLATPCSAPFLGTAIGFALSRGPVEILAVFGVMGIGFASPYLLVAALPGLAILLPRPGRWMRWFRLLMALALLGTALWLASVLANAQGAAVALPVGLTAGAMLVLLAVRARLAAPGLRHLLGGGVVLLLALAFWVPANTPPAPPPVLTTGFWRPFTPDVLASTLAEGKIVLVDVTADWCINCKVNKTLVLDAPLVAGLLADGKITGLRADWTRPDPMIASYLASFGRYGIPFNVVYGPARPGGIPLPELLTEEAVRTALTQASSP